VPLIFGAFSPPALRRMAAYGDGYVGPTAPPAMVGGVFEAARTAWKQAGREGQPRLIATAYGVVGDTDKAREGVAAYYTATPRARDIMVNAICTTPDAIRDMLKQFEDLGTDEIMVFTGSDDPDDVERLADLVL
jgi:alkanesulfonate monooxygenase SsuD/methylene tetrahydromethanopterin reductase-like flavin-dependent oxidoreductase (luciferase family)